MSFPFPPPTNLPDSDFPAAGGRRLEFEQEEVEVEMLQALPGRLLQASSPGGGQSSGGGVGGGSNLERLGELGDDSFLLVRWTYIVQVFIYCAAIGVYVYFFGSFWLGRWALYLWVTGIGCAVIAHRGYDNYQDSSTQWWVNASGVVILILIVSFYLYANYIFPCLARRRWCCFKGTVNRRCFYRVRHQHTGQPKPARLDDGGCYGLWRYTYNPQVLLTPDFFLFLCCGSLRICTFTYEGEVDAQGRPHGFGRWSDSEPHGETLKGTWAKGRPVGPFIASETGSGFSLRFC